MIEFRGVHKTCRAAGREIPALQPTRLNIQAGQVLGLIGHPGAGRSTLLCLISHLEEPSSGRILIEGEDVTVFDVEGLRRFHQRVGMIFQHFNLLSSKAVAGNITIPLRLAGSLSRAGVGTRASELLVRVGPSDHVRKYPVQLSGGQKRRIDIARVLACQPDILLCNEAISTLDSQITASALQLLVEINHELKLAIVLTIHGVDVIRRVCDQVVVMDGGAIVEQGDIADAFPHPQHPTIRRFVFKAERVDEDERHDDFACAPSLILRLTFRGKATYAPLLGTVARQTGVDYSVLSGRIDRVKDMPYGQSTLALVGDDLETAMSQLNAADVYVEVLR